MPIATVTRKGQITIPATVRRSLQVEVGDAIQFLEIEPGQYLLIPATHSVTELKGMAGKARKPVSLEDMDRAIMNAGASAK